MPSLVIKQTTKVGPAYALFGFFGWLTSREGTMGPYGKGRNMTDLWVAFNRFQTHERWDWESEESQAIRDFITWIGHQEDAIGPFSKSDSTAEMNYNICKWCEYKRYDLGDTAGAIAATQALQPYPD